MCLQVAVRKQLSHFELNVTLECPQGSLLAIVGPSGAGKTTLLRVLAGLEETDVGMVSLNGRTWIDTAARFSLPTQKRRVGFVFQDYGLFPHFTVRRNVTFAGADPERANELLDLFGIRHLEHRLPGAVSGGERQRAAFCQALARGPDLLLLDEPFSALDMENRLGLRQALQNLKHDLDIPVLHVTHDLDEAMYLGDAVLPLAQGQVDPDWLSRQRAEASRAKEMQAA